MSDNSDRMMSDFQRARRLVLAVLVIIVAGLLVVVQSAHDELMHERIESVGMMFILIGIGGRLWATLYIGGRKSAEIVDTGPYSVTRNPLYFFSTVAVMGVGAQVGSYVLSFGFAALCWLAFIVVIRREESFLSARMGQPYLDYLNRVPRFFPKPWLFRDQDEVSFQPHLLKRTMMDGLAFFISVPVFEFIETAQDYGWLPILLYLP